MAFFDGLTDRDILEACREDFRAAVESRRTLEERRLNNLKLYRRVRDEVDRSVNPGAGGGPFGWSRMTVPLIFWITETILPRIGVEVPKPTVTPETLEAAPYAQACQLRLDRLMARGWYEERALVAIKQMLVLGEGPVKVPWDASVGGPVMLPVPWFDFFLSPEAMFWDSAEVMFHRTWWTRRALEELARQDKQREGGPIYDHDALENMAANVGDRGAQDETYQERREAAGLDPSSAYGDTGDQVAMVECWLADGSRAVIGGHGETPEYLLRVVRCEDSTFRDERGVPWRPFSMLMNTPDPGFLPYGVSDAEVLEDHQAEISTLRNQTVDQATANINAPIAFDQQRISPADIQGGFSVPRGLIPVDGPIDAGAIQRFPPGSLSGDHDRLVEYVRSEAQMISGVSDISAGQMGYGADNSTATGMSIIQSESNMRHKAKMKFVQLGMRRVAWMFHQHDRIMGPRLMDVPVPKGFQPDPGQWGINLDESGGFASVGRAGYQRSARYSVKVDAGTMAAPGQSEQAQKARALAMDLGGNPMVAQMVDWRALAEMLVTSHGFDPQRILAPMPPPPPPPGTELVPGGPVPPDSPVPTDLGA